MNRVEATRGLVYEFKTCARNVFESSTGLLVREGREGGPDSVRVPVPADSVRAWLAHADAIDLWAYPADFGRDETLVLGPDSSYTSISPSSLYRLDVRDGARTTIVRWSTRLQGPLSPRAAKLRAFAARIERSTGAWDRLRELPSLGYFCL